MWNQTADYSLSGVGPCATDTIALWYNLVRRWLQLAYKYHTISTKWFNYLIAGKRLALKDYYGYNNVQGVLHYTAQQNNKSFLQEKQQRNNESFLLAYKENSTLSSNGKERERLFLSWKKKLNTFENLFSETKEDSSEIQSDEFDKWDGNSFTW